MKTLLITLLLIANLAGAIETCDYTDAKEADVFTYEEFEAIFGEYFQNDAEAIQALYEDFLADEHTDVSTGEQWLIGLSKNLMQHDDINVNILALSHLNFSFVDQVDTTTGDPVLPITLKLSVLNQALESDVITVTGLLSARNMCAEANVIERCHVALFSQKLFAMEPDNLSVYFSDLEQAVNDEDQELIDTVLKQMSEAQFDQVLNPLTVTFRNAIKSYIEDNPIAEDLVEELAEEYGTFVVNDNEALFYHSTLAMYYMSSVFQIPAYRPLVQACEGPQTNHTHCLQIADVMIEHSDTNISTMIGYAIKQQALESLGNDEQSAEVAASSESFNDYTYCLVKNYAKMDSEIMMLDDEMIRLMVNSEHEGKYLEQAALRMYDLMNEAEIEGLIDPRSCGLRYTRK